MSGSSRERDYIIIEGDALEEVPTKLSDDFEKLDGSDLRSWGLSGQLNKDIVCRQKLETGWAPDVVIGKTSDGYRVLCAAALGDNWRCARGLVQCNATQNSAVVEVLNHTENAKRFTKDTKARIAYRAEA